MGYSSLEACVRDLERHGHLVRVTEEVDPYLELAEIHRRVIAAGGPALLFTNVKGKSFPLVTNLFGTARRASLAFGTRPQVSGELMRYGQPGPGRWITVYANTGHAYIVVAGLRFDTADYSSPGSPTAGQSGPRWRLGPRPSTNFVVRHPRDL